MWLEKDVESIQLSPDCRATTAVARGAGNGSFTGNDVNAQRDCSVEFRSRDGETGPGTSFVSRNFNPAPKWLYGRRRWNIAFVPHFDIIRNVESKAAVTALAALAQESRLAIFRLLVAAGPAGLAAGKIAEALAMPPSSLSFHLKELNHAALVSSRQESRFVIYSANFAAMNALIAYLTENCCGGIPCLPTPVAIDTTSRETST